MTKMSESTLQLNFKKLPAAKYWYNTKEEYLWLFEKAFVILILKKYKKINGKVDKNIFATHVKKLIILINKDFFGSERLQQSNRKKRKYGQSTQRNHGKRNTNGSYTHTKRCLILSVIREIQIKMILVYHVHLST